MKHPKAVIGRPVLHTDKEILSAIRHGADTIPALLVALGQTHKTSLLTRLRRMERAGIIQIVERRGPHGFLLVPVKGRRA